jgi:hypothetical protein
VQLLKVRAPARDRRAARTHAGHGGWLRAPVATSAWGPHVSSMPTAATHAWSCPAGGGSSRSTGPAPAARQTRHTRAGVCVQRAFVGCAAALLRCWDVPAAATQTCSDAAKPLHAGACAGHSNRRVLSTPPPDSRCATSSGGGSALAAVLAAVLGGVQHLRVRHQRWGQHAHKRRKQTSAAGVSSTTHDPAPRTMSL